MISVLYIPYRRSQIVEDTIVVSILMNTIDRYLKFYLLYSTMFLYSGLNSQKAPLSLKLSFKNVSPHFLMGTFQIPLHLLTKFLLTRDCGDMKFPLCLVFLKKNMAKNKKNQGKNQPLIAMSCIII